MHQEITNEAIVRDISLSFGVEVTDPKSRPIVYLGVHEERVVHVSDGILSAALYIKPHSTRLVESNLTWKRQLSTLVVPAGVVRTSQQLDETGKPTGDVKLLDVCAPEETKQRLMRIRNAVDRHLRL